MAKVIDLLNKAIDFVRRHKVREVEINDDVLAVFFGIGKSLDLLLPLLRPLLHSLLSEAFS